VLPHLDSAYNLARWLIRNDHDAQDLVQESCLRALRSFEGFRGGDARAWLLAIFRNRCYTRLHEDRLPELTTAFEEEIHTAEERSRSPEALLLGSADARRVKDALEQLPPRFERQSSCANWRVCRTKRLPNFAAFRWVTVMSRRARASQRFEPQFTGLVEKGALP
jgi:RNA polymerase sigma-70 factor (ECF subfamily)